jgi:hypothetical protein
MLLLIERDDKREIHNIELDKLRTLDCYMTLAYTLGNKNSSTTRPGG